MEVLEPDIPNPLEQGPDFHRPACPRWTFRKTCSPGPPRARARVRCAAPTAKATASSPRRWVTATGTATTTPEPEIEIRRPRPEAELASFSHRCDSNENRRTRKKGAWKKARIEFENTHGTWKEKKNGNASIIVST